MCGSQHTHQVLQGGGRIPHKMEVEFGDNGETNRTDKDPDQHTYRFLECFLWNVKSQPGQNGLVDSIQRKRHQTLVSKHWASTVHATQTIDEQTNLQIMCKCGANHFTIHGGMDTDDMLSDPTIAKTETTVSTPRIIRARYVCHIAVMNCRLANGDIDSVL